MKNTILIHTIWRDVDGKEVNTFRVTTASSQQEIERKAVLSVMLDIHENGMLAMPVSTEIIQQADGLKYTAPDECQVFLPA